jgi:tRNA (guanine-N7-)-methyltransferase
MNAPRAQPRRPIRSFVLRQGRFSPAQQRARDALLPRFGIPYAPDLVDLAAAFGRDRPKILEIGSGMGDATTAIAEAQPDRDFIAVEVHSPGVGGLLKLIDERRLANVRVIQHDAAEVITDMIGPGALAGIHVFFPDPWPKKRHHKRRLLQPAFIHALAERLSPGGYLHVATDWEDYATDILAAAAADSLLINTTTSFAPRPAYRPATKFERRGLELGHAVWDIVFTRR